MGNDQKRQIINSSNIAGVNLGDESDIKAENIDQDYSYLNGISGETLLSLRNDVKTLTKDKKEVIDEFEALRQALIDHDQERSTKSWKWLWSALGNTSSIIAIGTALGLL